MGANEEVISGLEIHADFEEDREKELGFEAHPAHIAFITILGLSSLLLLFIIFQFNDRKKQIKLTYIGIVLLLAEILALVLLTDKGPFLLAGRDDVIEVQWGFALPIAAAILTWMAIKRIQADEELVKSVDRIR